MFTKLKIAKALVAGSGAGLVLYAVGAVSQPFIGGISGPLFAAAGFVLGFAHQFLEEPDQK